MHKPLLYILSRENHAWLAQQQTELDEKSDLKKNIEASNRDWTKYKPEDKKDKELLKEKTELKTDKQQGTDSQKKTEDKKDISQSKEKQ